MVFPRESPIYSILAAWVLTMKTIVALQLPNITSLDLSSFSINSTSLGQDDERFSMKVLYGETDLPVTPVFMNTVELLAQYGETDFLGRTRQRHGIVLPGYPQVEIAIIPAPPATSIETRLVIWALYGTVIDMAFQNKFQETESPFRWDEQIVGYIYFTIPVNLMQNHSNQTSGLQVSTLVNELNATQSANGSLDSMATVPPGFTWSPNYKANGKILSPKDVFVLSMGAIKCVAEFPSTDKVDGPFHIGSTIIDAHGEIYLHRRKTPRPQRPFFLYGHIIEFARRVPAYMLEQRRFAEFWGNIQIYRVPVGVVMYMTGQYNTDQAQADSALAASS